MTLHDARKQGIRVRRKGWDRDVWLVGMMWRFVRMNDASGDQITYYLTPEDIMSDDWVYEDQAMAKARAQKALSHTVYDFDEVPGLL